MRIAISGHSGCGNTTATHNVATVLGLGVLNYTFRNLAQDIGLAFEDLHRRSPDDFIFDYLTDLVCIRKAIPGNIIVGNRLAAWLMDADLRIWLHASLEARSARISKRENTASPAPMAYEAALYSTLKRDEQNRKRYLQVYGIDINDRSELDITINTEKLTAEQVSGLIAAAATWAKDNSLSRLNSHLPRIKKIIAKNLKIPENQLFDPAFELNLKELYLNNRLVP